MVQSRSRVARTGTAMAVLGAALLAGANLNHAAADVTAVRGSAFGVFADNIVIFGGAQADTGPVPTVTLPSGGSSSPVTGNAPTTLVRYGPATIFSSGAVDLSTQGTTGPNGTVTTSVNIANVNTSQQEVFTASGISSTCTASESQRTGSTTVNGGTLRTSEGDPNVTGDDVIVNIPANPAPNTEYTGTIETVGDNFRYVFNEQVVGADGSITVNAAHLYLLGPTATGDVIIGQSVCGVTATASTTTTAPGATTTTTAPGATTTTAPGATTTTAPGATTTTAPGATTTTAQATTTTAQATTTTAQTTTTTAPATTTTTTAPATTGVGGSAYGYYASVSLFGGPAQVRGPAPRVTLPEGGSATPIADTLGSATVQFGPATIFSSDQLEVSTEGTPGGTVTSSARISNVNRSGQEQLTLATVNSTCSASGSGETGSVTLTGGRLTTSSGTNFDSEADDTIVDLPANPAPNTTFDGMIENVGDRFRVVLNEQIPRAGELTVRAVHMYLEGPTAVGELIIGQVVCSTTGAAGGGSGGGTGTGGGGGGGGGLASTGAAIAVFVAFSMVLVVGGSTTTYWIQGVRLRERGPRRMPWTARRLLR